MLQYQKAQIKGSDFLTDLKLVVAENIAELRKKNKMTQIELAEKLNYSDKAVSKWERGESIPDVAVLKTIADLFGVTVDYLLEQEHKSEPQKTSKTVKKNRLIISLLAVVTVWLIATIIFVVIQELSLPIKTWLTYIYAVPISFVVALVFNSIWGKPRLNFLIISLLIWSTLLSLYLSLLSYNIWLIFLVGVPSQIIVLLWSRIKMK